MAKTANQAIVATIIEDIRAAEQKGWTRHAIAEQSGVPHPILYGLLDGSRQDLTTATADKLLAFFGRRLTKPRIPVPPKK